MVTELKRSVWKYVYGVYYYISMFAVFTILGIHGILFHVKVKTRSITGSIGIMASQYSIPKKYCGIKPGILMKHIIFLP